MSAWLVSRGHIDILVQALIAEGLCDPSEATPTGKMLWTENMASLHARYGDPINEDLLDDYRFRGVEAQLDDACVAAAIACFEYQACEPGDRRGSYGYLSGLPWEDTLACRVLMALWSAVAQRVGVSEDDLGDRWHAESDRRERERGGYPGIPWGFESIEQATVAGVAAHLGVKA